MELAKIREEVQAYIENEKTYPYALMLEGLVYEGYHRRICWEDGKTERNLCIPLRTYFCRGNYHHASHLYPPCKIRNHHTSNR